MAERDEVKLVSPEIEPVNDPIIPNAQAKLRAALQTMMREIFQPLSQVPDSSLDPRPHVRRQFKQNRVELARVNLSSLIHVPLIAANADPALAQIFLPAFNAGDKLWIQFSLVFQVIGEPVLQLPGLIPRQVPDLSFDGFEFAHATTVSLAWAKSINGFRLEAGTAHSPSPGVDGLIRPADGSSILFGRSPALPEDSPSLTVSGLGCGLD